MTTGIYVNPVKEIHCYFGTDTIGRNFVAGKTGSGKSLLLRGIASKHGFYYIDGTMTVGKHKVTCEQFMQDLKLVGNVKGIVFDLETYEIQDLLTDFESYKWNIPIWYALRLNSEGLTMGTDAKFFKLLSEDENVCT